MRLLSFITIVCLGLAWMAVPACRQADQGPVYGGSLRIGIFHKPTEINPLTTDSSISANLLDIMFDYLIRFDSEGGVHPWLAERWEISSDGLTWTFYLRKGIQFHNGITLDASDVKFTFDYMTKNKRIAYTNFFTFVREIKVLNQQTFQILLTKPDNSLWTALGMIGIVPRHLLSGVPDFTHFNQHPIGTGPYRFVKQDAKEIVLEANKDYFQGRPYLDHIVVKILPDQGTVLNHLIAGKINMAFLLNPEDYGALAKIPEIKIYKNWYPLLYILTLNHQNPLFASATVRRALNEAIDKEKIIQRLMPGKGSAAASTVSPKNPQYNLQVTPYTYSPNLALQKLKKVGWQVRENDILLVKAGKPFEFTAYATEGHSFCEKILLNIQEQLREIGIKMDVSLVPFDDYIRRTFRKRTFDANLIYFIFRPFFDYNFIFWHSSQIKGGLNFSSYDNPEIDRLLMTARLSPDPAKRKAAFLKFQQAIHDDPPGIFLFWRNMPIAVHRRFRGIPEKKMDSLRDLVHVWVPKAKQIQMENE